MTRVVRQNLAGPIPRLRLERALLGCFGAALILVGLFAGRGYRSAGELVLGFLLLAATAAAQRVPALRWGALAIALWLVLAPLVLTVGATRAVLDPAIGLAIACLAVVTQENRKAAGFRVRAPGASC